MTRRRTMYACLAGLAMIGLLAIIVVVRVNGRAALTPEFYLHLFGRISQREGQLIREFYDFKGEFMHVLFAADCAPPDSSRDGILRWMRLGMPAAQQNLPSVVSGKDPWGHPLIFDLQVNDLGIEFEVKGVIRSVGVNGRDEQGKGDDIQVKLGEYIFSDVCDSSTAKVETTESTQVNK